MSPRPVAPHNGSVSACSLVFENGKNRQLVSVSGNCGKDELAAYLEAETKRWCPEASITLRHSFDIPLDPKFRRWTGWDRFWDVALGAWLAVIIVALLATAAPTGEAGTAETVKQGSVHEHAVPQGMRPETSGH